MLDRIGSAVVLAAVAALLSMGAVAALALRLALFEDGSFRIVGCLPWALCALGG